QIPTVAAATIIAILNHRSIGSINPPQPTSKPQPSSSQLPLAPPRLYHATTSSPPHLHQATVINASTTFISTAATSSLPSSLRHHLHHRRCYHLHATNTPLSSSPQSTTTSSPPPADDSATETTTTQPFLGASPSSDVNSLTFQPHSPKERPGLGIMKHTQPKTQDSLNKSVSGAVTMLMNDKINTKTHEQNLSHLIQEVHLKVLYYMICKREDHGTLDHEMYNDLLKRSENYKALPCRYASPPKQILKAKVKPFQPCIHYGFNDHRPDDCRNYPECEIYRSYYYLTLGHNRVIHVRGVLAESSQSKRRVGHLKWLCLSSRWLKTKLILKSKQIRADNGIEFSNIELESFCDEKGISQNFSSPYTPDQNGIAKKKNKTLIEAAKTMQNGSILSKHFWTKAVRIACYTQNRSIIIKRHDRNPYKIFRERIADISYFYVFRCPVFIRNHKDYLRKFDAKAYDGYFLG
nr:retrovirus-related Pol polyprotein from transposon TNT 1-94 [Tanacetum cinerariifolium]